MGDNDDEKIKSILNRIAYPDSPYTGHVRETRVKCATLEQRCDCTAVEVVTDVDGVAREFCKEHAHLAVSKHTRTVQCSHCESLHGIYRMSDKDLRRVQCPHCRVWHGV